MNNVYRSLKSQDKNVTLFTEWGDAYCCYEKRLGLYRAIFFKVTSTDF